MNTKNILTVFGVVLLLQGMLLFFGAQMISTEAFAALNPTDTGIQIGTKMHEVVGITNINIALILLFSRGLPSAAGAKVLMGASTGLALIVAHGYYNLFATQSKPPIPLMVVMTILTIVGFITSFRANSAE